MITLLFFILFVENLSILLFFAKEFKMETILEEVLDAVSNVLQEIEAKVHDLLISKDKVIVPSVLLLRIRMPEKNCLRYY